MYYIKTTNHINIINAEPQAALSRSPCWLLQGVQSSLHSTCSPAHDTGADARVHVHICTHMYLDYPGPIHILLQYTTIYTLSLLILYACLCAHSFRYSKFVRDDTLVFHCKRGTCLMPLVRFLVPNVFTLVVFAKQLFVVCFYSTKSENKTVATWQVKKESLFMRGLKGRYCPTRPFTNS